MSSEYVIRSNSIVFLLKLVENSQETGKPRGCVEGICCYLQLVMRQLNQGFSEIIRTITEKRFGCTENNISRKLPSNQSVE